MNIIHREDLYKFAKINHKAREQLKKGRRHIDILIKENEENGYINNNILLSLKDKFSEVLDINVDVRDAIKIERIKSGDVDIIDNQPNTNSENVYNSSITATEETTIDDIVERFNVKVLSKYDEV